MINNIKKNYIEIIWAIVFSFSLGAVLMEPKNYNIKVAITWMIMLVEQYYYLKGDGKKVIFLTIFFNLFVLSTLGFDLTNIVVKIRIAGLCFLVPRFFTIVDKKIFYVNLRDRLPIVILFTLIIYFFYIIDGNITADPIWIRLIKIFISIFLIIGLYLQSFNAYQQVFYWFFAEGLQVVLLTATGKIELAITFANWMVFMLLLYLKWRKKPKEKVNVF